MTVLVDFGALEVVTVTDRGSRGRLGAGSARNSHIWGYPVSAVAGIGVIRYHDGMDTDNGSPSPPNDDWNTWRQASEAIQEALGPPGEPTVTRNLPTGDFRDDTTIEVPVAPRTVERSDEFVRIYLPDRDWTCTIGEFIDLIESRR